MEDERVFKLLTLLLKIVMFVVGLIVMVLILQKNLSGLSTSLPDNLPGSFDMLKSMPSILSQADVSKGIDSDLLTSQSEGDISYVNCNGLDVSSTSLAAKSMNGKMVYTLILSTPTKSSSGEYSCKIYFNNSNIDVKTR
ncbi:hypothetical protein COV13_03990 [Candidatus Woesearchaeota archaeon CG10_big_fil_rev_8_21_14_0_10_32_9]|nr:MAG: hypothetical protein COV13_03990 [Candidatus Woesearchaeota archaeon CG10_big_fil_rev_8_21_14_0_10_32_9]